LAKSTTLELMAEFLQNSDQLLQDLLAYGRGLLAGQTTRDHFDRYLGALDQAGAYEVNWVIHHIAQEASNLEALKVWASRFIRACGKGLDRQALSSYPTDSFLFPLVTHTGNIEKAQRAMGPFYKQMVAGDFSGLSTLKGELARALQVQAAHYSALQNEIFPRFEQTSKEHNCTSLMWSIQDDILAMGRKILKDLRSWSLDKKDQFTRDFGKYSLDTRTLVYRELHILYPLIERLAAHGLSNLAAKQGETLPAVGFTSTTGNLTVPQLASIFSSLPLDCTFIDHEDRVRFFSDTPDRVFARHPAILGREVSKCHPPKSVDRVEEILKDLKSGKQDRFQFWLDYKGRKILISYYALRGKGGEYLGVLETTQDITDIQSLTGEKRL